MRLAAGKVPAVLAEVFVTRGGFMVFTMRPEDEKPRLSGRLVGDVEDLERFTRETFGAADVATAIDAIDHARWRALTQPLVDPIVAASREGEVVWLVPHSFLHRAPLHAAPVGEGTLAERNPVCYTPSAAVMRACRERSSGRFESALVVGDSLGDLPAARQEARSVARLFATDAHFGARATKRLVQESLAARPEGWDVIHFACHGHFAEDDPLESSIQLAPESGTRDSRDRRWHLTAREISRLPLRANLVALSACESGVNERRPGDELVGLERAIIAAGAASALLTLWRVSDLSSAVLMRRFYEELDGAASKAHALQAAQRHVREMTVSEFTALLAELIDAVPDDTERQTELLALRSTAATRWAGRGTAFRPFRSMFHWAAPVLVGDWR